MAMEESDVKQVIVSCCNCKTNVKRMHELLQKADLSDVVLIAGNDKTRIPAHRSILSEASEYFKAMLSGSLREAKENEITLKEIDGNILKSLVEYCYSGVLDCNEDNYEALFITANMLQMCSAEKICCSFMFSKMNTSNCLEFQELAERCKDNTFLKLVTEYVCSNFTDVCKSEKFFDLTAERLKNLLANDNIEICSEEQVFYAIKSWIEYDFSSRIKDVLNLLQSVRFSLLSSSFIVDHVEKFCESVDGYAELIKEGLKYHLRDRSANCPAIRYHLGSTTLVSVNGCAPINIEQFCPTNRTWKLLANIPITGRNYRVAFFENKIIIVGGSNDDYNRIITRVEIFDLNFMLLRHIYPMRTSLESSSIVIFRKSLYVIGGNDDFDSYNIVQRWCFRNREWYNYSNLNVKRSLAGSAVLNDRIFVTGGMTDRRNSISSVECTNPTTGAWEQKTSMIYKRAGHALAVLDDSLYAIGGSHLGVPTRSVERYDFNSDTWTLMASLNGAYDHIYATVLEEDRLIVVGISFCEKTVEEYDPELNKWMKLCDPIYQRQQCFGILTVSNQLIPKFKK